MNHENNPGPQWLPADNQGREVLAGTDGRTFVAPAAVGRFYAHVDGRPFATKGTKNAGARLCTFETREGARAGVLRELRRRLLFGRLQELAQSAQSVGELVGTPGDRRLAELAYGFGASVTDGTPPPSVDQVLAAVATKAAELGDVEQSRQSRLTERRLIAHVDGAPVYAVGDPEVLDGAPAVAAVDAAGALVLLKPFRPLRLVVVDVEGTCPHCRARAIVRDAERTLASAGAVLLFERMPSGVDNLHCNACGRDSPVTTAIGRGPLAESERKRARDWHAQSLAVTEPPLGDERCASAGCWRPVVVILPDTDGTRVPVCEKHRDRLLADEEAERESDNDDEQR